MTVKEISTTDRSICKLLILVKEMFDDLFDKPFKRQTFKCGSLCRVVWQMHYLDIINTRESKNLTSYIHFNIPEYNDPDWLGLGWRFGHRQPRLEWLDNHIEIMKK